MPPSPAAPALRRAPWAAMCPAHASRTSPATSSGNPLRRTSRTSCGKPTRSSPPAGRRPRRRRQRLPAGVARPRAPRPNRRLRPAATAAARRQVLIEATLVEVTLSDGYQQGIDWSHLGGTAFGVKAPTLDANTGSPITPFKISYLSKNLSIDVSLLEAFGTVKVLSSPKLAVLNNQTAMLKVVDEFVYFNVKADTITTVNVGTSTTFTTTPQSVSVGVVMAVTPQVADDGEITLNVRPTISSIQALKPDPNQALAEAGVTNEVPQIRTREIESVLRLRSGEVAVLGGLMEDRLDYKTGRVPILGAIPILGEALTSRVNAVQKTELVIFLRPVVLDSPAAEARLDTLREQLPGQDFFSSRPIPGTRNFPSRPLVGSGVE